VNQSAIDAFERARANFCFKSEQTSHRRGDFLTFATGISYGGGQTASFDPFSALALGANSFLLSNPAIIRMAKFSESSMRLFAPRMHAYYEDTPRKILARYPTLKENFKNGVVGAAKFNLRPDVVTFMHLDSNNLPAGWCAITALGDYDPKEGGHSYSLGSWADHRVPPGSTILIPSAMQRHSNMTIQPCIERRHSFTQCSAGRLFRWVECGFKTRQDFFADGSNYDLTGAGTRCVEHLGRIASRR
ncbi:hypothetical protein C8Q78DRAFT_978274, partial [Trametes maxima]